MSSMDMIVFDSLARSNMPTREKTSLIRRFADEMTGGRAGNYINRAERSYGHHSVETFLDTFRQASEQPAMGAILGALAAKRMLDVKKVPVDMAGGLFLTGMGAIFAHKGYSRDLVNLGTANLTVFAFRKVFGLLADHGASMAGEDDWSSSSSDSDTGADPIVEAAKEL